MKKKEIMKKLAAIALTASLLLSATACGAKESTAAADSSAQKTVTEQTVTEDTEEEETEAEETESTAEAQTANTTTQTETIVSTAAVTSGGAIDASDLFTERDLTQTADLSEASYITVKDDEDINITQAGVYVISGSASEVTIRIEAGDEDKVQLVLDGVSITNSDFPCIYVVNADKVFVTTTEGSENSLSVTGAFTADGETNTDGAIFAKDDLVLNGLGTLSVSSTDHGIVCKNDIKITGGTLIVDSASSAIQAKDSISVADGTLILTSDTDGLHAADDDDDTTGWIYICGGTMDIDVGDDGIHASTIVQIDGGTLSINAAEAIEGTWVQVNGGDIEIYATDDGINASAKSSAYTILAEFNGGYTTIQMGQGDTDAVDSNGYIVVNGGTLDITAQSPFDYDYGAEYNGGTIIVNGTETNEITNQMMGGGMMGGQPGGNMGGQGGPQGGGQPGGPGGHF